VMGLYDNLGDKLLCTLAGSYTIAAIGKERVAVLPMPGIV